LRLNRFAAGTTASALVTTLFGAVTLLTAGAPSHAQTIPAEIGIGHHYATTNLVVSKPLSKTSRLGYFHLSTIGIDYDDTDANDLAIQNLLFVRLPGSLRLAGGAFHSERGFSPTLGVQYVRGGRDLFVLVAPRVNVESDPSYSVFSIVRYKPSLTESTRLYLGAQLLNTFDARRHIKSYQWLRVGLEIRGTQFGLAFNLDEDGPDPGVELGVGVFVRREIF
jgi:hypothetical protein